MRRSILAAAALAPLAGVAWAGGGGKIQWRDGSQHDVALAEARVTGTPVMLYFTADW